MNRFFRVFLTNIFLSTVVFAQDKMTIAELDLDLAGGVPASYQSILSDRLRQELSETGAFTVLERGKMESILNEQGFQASGCTTNECAVQMGQLLGVRRMVAGTIGLLGTLHTITVRLIDVSTGEVTVSKSVDCECGIEEVVKTQLRDAANLLSGKNAPSIDGQKVLSKAIIDAKSGILPDIDNFDFIELGDGLKYFDLIEGNGIPIRDGQVANVHYTGWLTNGRQFDSSRKRDRIFEFKIGDGRVIKGWDKGVNGMKVGGQRLLYLPYSFGYGPTGAGGAIPPYADLIFEVELVRIK